MIPTTWLLGVWERIRSSFWFLPSAMTVAAIALSFAFIEVDHRLGADMVERFGWLYTFGPEGARAILSTIASSMITVAGLTFSITMLTLQLASSQFGPRLLRNFMRDRGNQIVLGTFIANFIYCLLVLRVVRGTEGDSFVPHMSVAFGVLLATAGIAVLIYFIHHIATSIRIETLLTRLTEETREAIDRLFPRPVDTDRDNTSVTHELELPEPLDFATNSIEIFPQRSGYIQWIDFDALLEVADKCDLVIRLETQPGHFVLPSRPIARIYPITRIDDAIDQRLTKHFAIGSERTPQQDLEYSLRRMVEIAQRALSPGVNDPTTALYCIDRLGEVFAAFAQRATPSPQHVDKQGKLRLITSAATFDALACKSFAAVARYGLGDADVIAALLAEAERVSAYRPTPSVPLLSLCEDIRRSSLRDLSLAFDQARLRSPRGSIPGNGIEK